MQDWSVTRLDINRKVRKVLVSHGIDLGLITVRVYPRRIILRGHMNRLAGSGEPLDATAVENVIRDLERIEEVHNVFHDLGNWTFCSHTRKWQKVHSLEEEEFTSRREPGPLLKAPRGPLGRPSPGRA